MIFDIDTKGKEILDEPKILSELIISLDDDTLFTTVILELKKEDRHLNIFMKRNSMELKHGT